MKINESYVHEATKPDKDDKPKFNKEVQKQNSADKSLAANKSSQTDFPVKDEMKFANILESSTKLQKTNQQHDDKSDDRRDDQNKEKKQGTLEKESSGYLTEREKTEKHQGSFSGQSGFGVGGNVDQSGLSGSFAARSILHIADLERLVSTIRTQMSLGGKREIIMQLKHSVLDGLKVKIQTDPAARVQIEFLAASEKVRTQIEQNSSELAEILRGRGIDLGAIKTKVDPDGSNKQKDDSSLPEENDAIAFDSNKTSVSSSDNLQADNTFTGEKERDGKIYNA